MKRILSLLLLLPVLAMAAPSESRESFPLPDGKALEYLQYLPEGYADSGEKVPLVIFLHGAGERGADLDKVKKHGPPRDAMKGHGFPFVLIAPQCPAGRWWDTGEILGLTKHIISTLRIDPSRVHLTGISMGGFGTWKCLAQEPTLFASGVPICGGGDVTTADLIKHIPVWAFHGEKDTIVPPEKTREMEAAILSAGGKLLRTTYYPELAHESWADAYAEPGLFAWMMLQKKQ